MLKNPASTVDTSYISLVKNIINNGYDQNDTRMLPMQTICCKDIAISFPIMQHKKLFLRGVWEELLFFLRGYRDVRKLQEKNVHIWDANADPNYKKIHHKNLEYWDLGPVYGCQWRNFNSENYDQLIDIVTNLKNHSQSRRLFMSAWNPCQLDEMVLPPCHVSYHFIPYLKNGIYTVDLMMYQRSADVMLGLPFNIASTALMLLIICYYCNCNAGNIMLCIGNAHIYNKHVCANDFDKVKMPENVTTPIVTISGNRDSSFDVFLDSVTYTLQNYNVRTVLKFPLVTST